MLEGLSAYLYESRIVPRAEINYTPFVCLYCQTMSNNVCANCRRWCFANDCCGEMLLIAAQAFGMGCPACIKVPTFKELSDVRCIGLALISHYRKRLDDRRYWDAYTIMCRYADNAAERLVFAQPLHLRTMQLKRYIVQISLIDDQLDASGSVQLQRMLPLWKKEIADALEADRIMDMVMGEVPDDEYP